MVDVAKDDAVEISFWSHSEEISPPVLFHLQDGIFDLDKFVSNKFIVRGKICKRCNDVCCFVFIAFEDEPLVLR